MKRLCKLAIVILFMLLLSSCGQKSDREPNAEGEADQTKSIEAETGKAKNIEMDELAEESPADENNTQTQEDEGAMKRDITFDFETKTVTLNSGYRMPIYGIGTYSLTDSECVDSVTAALENGVRLIDTAYMYQNEESVGEAVRHSGIPREEIFVITKLYPSQCSKVVYRPLCPELASTSVLAWKHGQPFSLAATKFISHIKCFLGMEHHKI